jgi:prepilin-type N-terminal cleavage/methylation domain-containing protein
MTKAEEGSAENPHAAHHARGFSLVELMIGVSLTLILSSASASLLGNFMATQKTLRVANNANAEINRLLRDIRRSFQASQFNGNENRACLLEHLNGDVNSLTRYQCRFTSVGQGGAPFAPAGIGFQLEPTVNVPRVAFVNVCEPIGGGISLPSGKGGRLVPPNSPRDEIENWGGANQICPAQCPDGQRPAVRFLTEARGNVGQRQFPSEVRSTSDLNLWGGVLCASYFEDQTRQLQNLFGTNAGAFRPAFMTVTAFIARGRFDVKAPINPDPPRIRASNYVWVHGGIVLEYNESQEMSTFKN